MLENFSNRNFHPDTSRAQANNLLFPRGVLTVLTALCLDSTFLGVFVCPLPCSGAKLPWEHGGGSTLSCFDSHIPVLGNPSCLQDRPQLGGNQRLILALGRVPDHSRWSPGPPHPTGMAVLALKEPPPETSKIPEDLQRPSSFPSPLSSSQWSSSLAGGPLSIGNFLLVREPSFP